MTVTEHLDELRRRILIVVVVLLVATVALYFVTPELIEFLIEPISEYLPDGTTGELNILDPMGGFTLRFKVAFVAAVLVTAPVWIWQLLAFFLPALKPNERKWVVPTFFVGIALFVLGNLFCYYIILDPAFGWLLGQITEFASVLADATQYINLILMFELAFGIAFELPLIIFYLIVFEIVPYNTFRKNWRIIYIVLMIVCAAITPDGSPVSMMLLYAALLGLYELSLAIARVVLRNKIEHEVGDEDDSGVEDAQSEKDGKSEKKDRKSKKDKKQKKQKSGEGKGTEGGAAAEAGAAASEGPAADGSVAASAASAAVSAEDGSAATEAPSSEDGGTAKAVSSDAGTEGESAAMADEPAAVDAGEPGAKAAVIDESGAGAAAPDADDVPSAGAPGEEAVNSTEPGCEPEASEGEEDA